MRLKKILRRMAGIVLASAMVLSSGQGVLAAPSEFPADFEHQESGYIVNGNFEGEDNFITGGAEKGLWFAFGAEKDLDRHHSGAASVKITGSGNAVDQQVELKPDTTYELSVWVYAEDGRGARVRAFLNGGAVQEDKKLLDTDENCFGKWYQYTNTFTTDADTTYANIGVVRAHASMDTAGSVWVDDFEIKEADAPVSAQRIDAETIEVQYPDTRAEGPSAEEISLFYGIEGASSLEALDFEVTWDGARHVAEITHANVSENAEVTVDFQLQISGEIFTQTVTLDVNPDYVSPRISEVKEMENGSAILVLEKTPTKDLTAGEIKISYTDYDGNPAELSVTDLEKKSGTEYAVKFGKIASRETDKTYTLTFQIGDTKVSEDLTVETTRGKTFYLDATNGNDENDGTSPETAWQSLDKVNETEFMAGSSLLLKAGETWTGTLAPKGSGAEGEPVILSSYGEGSRPRILMDEDAAYDETILRIAAVKTRKVNETFRLHNQSWWEISNIEFQNPNYEEDMPVDAGRALERGMYITAEDAGQLDHIYIDNVWIHGFQTSDGSNTGKESGGIIFLISANQDETKRKETWFNDISITNCIVEDVGRSGFFLLSPWKTREMTADGKWGGRWTMVNNAGEGSLGEFTPTTNVYIGKNIFRNISGDGIILQCMDGAVAEYNLVDETCTGNWFAAGIFPYLVSNGTVQFNELCRTYRGNDAQGVEIDALNEDFAVLYNYSHENSGGFVQFCAYGNLPTYDSYYAFNISENDGSCGPGTNSVIMPLNAAINCSVFNNTVYLDPYAAVDNDNQDRFFNNNSSDNQSVAIYNNIFYRAGNTYKFNQNEVSYFNSMESLADGNVMQNGDDGRFANNLFYNFSTEGIDQDSAFYQDNIWGVDPKLSDPGTMGDGDAEALVKDNDISKAWKLDAYTLSEDSPAIDAGRAISTQYAELKDMLGNTVDAQNPDLGAIQYVGKDLLKAAVDFANVQKQAEYYQDVLPEVKAQFEQAVTDAQGVYENAEAGQDEVDAAYKDLVEKILLLDYTGDPNNLQLAFDLASGMDLSVYTEETRAEMEAAIAGARAVLEKQDATESEINAALNVLNEAREGLELIPDKENLGQLINEAEKLDLSKYTDETADKVESALELARAVLEDVNATGDEVAEAEANLTDAIAGLIEKEDPEEPGTGEKPGSGEKPGTGDKPGTGGKPGTDNDSVESGDADSKDKAVQTGDSAQGICMAALMILAGGTVLAVLAGRRKYLKK